jgi:hypothetical protein
VAGNTLWTARARWRLAQAEPSEEDSHICNPLAEGLGTSFVGSAAQNEVVFSHGRTTAGGVGDDRINICRASVLTLA